MRKVLDKISLRLKATAALVAIIFLLQTLGAVLTILDANRNIAADQARAANFIAGSVAHATELSLAVGDREELDRLSKSFLLDKDIVFVAIYDQADFLCAHAVNQIGLWERFRQDGDISDDLLVGQESVLVASADDWDANDVPGTARTAQAEAKKVGRVVVGLSTRPMKDAQASQAMVILRTTLIMLLVCGLCVYVPVASWTRRLADLLDASERISRGDLTQPIPADRHDEIGRLTKSFEEMRAALHARELDLRGFNQTLQQRVEERTRDLREATHLAQAAAKSKTEFLANMSHEIRTPMTAILGFADLLMDLQQPVEQRIDCVQTIRRNGDHLLVIINDILDISKIEAGKMQVERIACSPVQIVEEVVSLIRVRAIDKGLTLTAVYATPMPAMIQSDPTRLRQILMNLAGNAVKFTNAGSVKVVASLNTDGQDAFLTFDIIDTGPGLTKAQMANLFTPFTQADTSTTRKFGGTGLGLSISSRLATMLGGTITVESTPGQGSTFSVKIETGALDGVKMIERGGSEPIALSALAAPALGGALKGKILLAEDGLDNQRLIAFHLRKAGADVTIVENGQLAHDAAMEAWKSGEPFDLIVMDMQMPELDGYGATALLREHEYPGAIMALTAHAMAADRQKCLDVGCDEYGTKPVDRAKLIAGAVLAMQIAGKRIAAASGAAANDRA